MKAAYINQTGPSSEIIIGELQKPVISDDEALIKVHAVSVNNVDTYVRSGIYQTPLPFPFILGRDAIGEIVDIKNSDSSDFKVGDLVWTNSMGHNSRQGVTSEYAVIPVNRLYHAPENIDEYQLIASVHSSATAAIVLDSIFEVKPGKSILIEGAAGNVGRKFVQIAQQQGLKVITTSSTTDFKQMELLGSDFTLSYRDNLTDVLAANPEISRLDYIVDTSGKADLDVNLKNLNKHGIVCLITAPTNNQFTFDVRNLYMNELNLKGFVISGASIEQLQKASIILNENFKAGRLLEDNVELHNFRDIALLHDNFAKHIVGKTRYVLTF